MFKLFSNDEKNKDRIHELEIQNAILEVKLEHLQTNLTEKVDLASKKAEAHWDREAANWMIDKEKGILESNRGSYVACRDKQNDTIDRLCGALEKLSEKQPETPDVKILPTVCAAAPCIMDCTNCTSTTST